MSTNSDHEIDVMIIRHVGTRATALGLGFMFLLSGHAAAQEPKQPKPQDPQIARPTPEWTTDAPSGSMVLSPTTGKLALGLPSAETTLQIMGDHEVALKPGTGYLVLGTTDGPHMQLDRNDIRVAAPPDNLYGSLYLQRYGGPIVVHASQPLDARVYITEDGDLGVATADPLQFGIDRQLFSPNWERPPGIIAVDGDVWADRVRTRKLDVLEQVRIGPRISPSRPGPTWDRKHNGALLQVGGKITAQSIFVHLDKWADDVFEPGYPLMPLSELANFIERERHLPGVPTESDALAGGLDVGEANEVLLRKVEELTLYTIAQERRIEELERKIDALAK
jgi:hypothetical protein